MNPKIVPEKEAAKKAHPLFHTTAKQKQPTIYMYI